MENKSYIRSFTFYNDRTNNFRVPIQSNTVTQKFMTLGYFDELHTQLIELDDNDENYENNGNMKALWKEINRKNQNLFCSANLSGITNRSFQNIFGCSYYDENAENNKNGIEKSDAEFWESKNYSYIFVILVQFFDRETALSEKMKAYKSNFVDYAMRILEGYGDYFEDYATQEILDNIDKDFIISDYITFDRYDYILAVKSNCYLPFVLATQQLYSLSALNGNNIENKNFIALNSFTVTALNVNEENENVNEKLNNEIIPSICIKCNYDENNIFLYNKQNAGENRFHVFNFLEQFISKLEKVLYSRKNNNDNVGDHDHRLYYISGEDDIRIIARNVETKNLFKLFKDDTILKTDYLCGFSTVINVSAKGLVTKNIEYKQQEQATYKVREKLMNITGQINGLSERYPEELTKTLHQINSGLVAIKPENKYYRGYGFYSLYFDYAEFIQLLSAFQGTINQQFLDDAFQITKCLGSALLTTMRSDFREFQISSFNANLYYAPTKLLVLYRAYIYQLLKFYKTFQPNSTECFFISIGNRIRTEVSENLSLTIEEDGAEKKHKLFICSFSEKNIYLVKNSLFELTHEIAHHGINNVRRRKKRQDDILYLLVRSFFILLKINLADELWRTAPNYIDFADLYTEAFAYINNTQTYAQFNKIFNQKYKERDGQQKGKKNGSQYKTRKSHLEKSIMEIKKLVLDSCADIESFLMKNMMDIFPENCFKTVKDAELHIISAIYESRKECIQKAIQNTKANLFMDNDTKNIDSIIFLIKNYFKECFADAIAIVTMEISLEDYLFFWERTENKDSLANYRIYVVYEALNQYSSKHHCPALAIWKDAGSKIAGYKEFKEKQQTDWCGVWKNREINGYCDDARNFFFKDTGIFEKFVDYIERCVEKYYEKLESEQGNNKSSHNDDERFWPNQIYKTLTEGNIELKRKIIYMDDILRHYEEECLRDESSKKEWIKQEQEEKQEEKQEPQKQNRLIDMFHRGWHVLRNFFRP